MPIEPAVLPSDGAWLRFAAGDALLDVVNSYRNVKTKLIDVDQWYTIPVADESERHASQQWHRDPEDQHVVKAFLYFSDVDEDAGPFEYIRRSAEGSTYGHLWPWGAAETRYPRPKSWSGSFPNRTVCSRPGPPARSSSATRAGSTAEAMPGASLGSSTPRRT